MRFGRGDPDCPGDMLKPVAGGVDKPDPFAAFNDAIMACTCALLR